MNFDPHQSLKGKQAKITGPDGEQLTIYYLPVEGNVRYQSAYEREIERMRQGKLDQLNESVGKLVAGGSEGYMELNYRTRPTAGEKQEAEMIALNGAVLCGWESDSFPDRSADGDYHAENGAILLQIPWIYSALLGLLRTQNGIQQLQKEDAAKKSSSSRPGKKPGDRKPRASRNSKPKPKPSTANAESK